MVNTWTKTTATKTIVGSTKSFLPGAELPVSAEGDGVGGNAPIEVVPIQGSCTTGVMISHGRAIRSVKPLVYIVRPAMTSKSALKGAEHVIHAAYSQVGGSSLTFDKPVSASGRHCCAHFATFVADECAQRVAHGVVNPMSRKHWTNVPNLVFSFSKLYLVAHITVSDSKLPASFIRSQRSFALLQTPHAEKIKKKVKSKEE